VTARLTIEKVTKVFSDHPEQALPLLAAGASKDRVHSELSAVVALNGISLSVPAGAIYMIMGLSGSGKSTLARCVNRLIEPTAGCILLDGEDVLAASPQRLRELRRTRMSMVFQHFALLPHKSVVENVEFGLKLRGMPAAERRRKAEEFLAIVGLEQWASYRPSSLSGGMRQRVGLARALATDADLLIMDEAFSALDPLIRSEMQDELLALQKLLHKTILFITHDFQEALKLGTRIAILSDGAVVREGTPQEIVLEPRSDYVAAFTRDVDRARLFDAASVMTPAEDRHGFVVDRDGRFLGARAVARNAKLIEVARALNGAEQLAVTDEDGRLVGCIRAGDVLARIGQVPGNEVGHVQRG
jgi:glycine betaine/proline transport system ATP-binding protein